MEWIKITADTPLEEVQRMHKQIWDYVLEHGKKPEDCPYNACCAACEWEHEMLFKHYSAETLRSCAFCPIKWPDQKCCSDGFLYRNWLYTRFSHTARQIRDVEFKTKEEVLKCLEN